MRASLLEREYIDEKTLYHNFHASLQQKFILSKVFTLQGVFILGLYNKTEMQKPSNVILKNFYDHNKLYCEKKRSTKLHKM